MKFAVATAEERDLPELSIIQWSALHLNPLIQTLYPRGVTPALAEYTVESYGRARKDPHVRLLKATDCETGQIVAFAKWKFLDFRGKEMNGQSAAEIRNGARDKSNAPETYLEENIVPSLPPDCYVRALKAWNKSITTARTNFIIGKAHSCRFRDHHDSSCYFAYFSQQLLVLEILHTHPSVQGRGAGHSLLRWGTNLADEIAAVCYVEATVAALPLLQAAEFDAIAEIDLDLGYYKEGFGDYRHTVLTRQALTDEEPHDPLPNAPLESGNIQANREEHESPRSEDEYLEDDVSEITYTAEAKALEVGLRKEAANSSSLYI